MNKVWHKALDDVVDALKETEYDFDDARELMENYYKISKLVDTQTRIVAIDLMDTLKIYVKMFDR